MSFILACVLTVAGQVDPSDDPPTVSSWRPIEEQEKIASKWLKRIARFKDGPRRVECLDCLLVIRSLSPATPVGRFLRVGPRP
jgi:hypothetical protein